MTKRAISKTIFAACVLFPALTASAFAGEGFFQKIGDGPKRVIQDIITPESVDNGKGGASLHVQFVATMRVDCQDAQTGVPRGDNTITAISHISQQDAANQVFAANDRVPLCQQNGDTTRIAIPGTFRWMN
jgi:hypothetical protein